MPYDAKVYAVMIASPSDVVTEREIICDVIHEWNAINSNSTKRVLLPLSWDTHSAPEMGDRPQEIINKQVLRDADLLVAVFWTRIGSSTGKAISGTVEEIEEHIASGKPVMIYFSQQPVTPDSVEEEQYRALKEFRAKCKEKGLIETYQAPDEFREKFSRQLARTVTQNEYFKLAGAADEAHRKSPNAVIQTKKAETAIAMSKEAQILLKQGSLDRTGSILKVPAMGGNHVQSNSREFSGPSDEARTRARWEGAIDELIRMDLLRETDSKGMIFQLTAAGYDIADTIEEI